MWRSAGDHNGDRRQRYFAVDEWARCQNCAVLHPQCIRNVSGKLLAGKTVHIKTEEPVAGRPPQGVKLVAEGTYDVYVGFASQPEEILWLVPRAVVLGVGCRKGTTAETLEAALDALPLPRQAVCAAASINLKAQEPGLLSFCSQNGWNLQTYSAEELAQVPGDFSTSAFVKKTTGVDNVCERAAVRCSEGVLLCRKTAGAGVTLATAVKPYQLDWRFHNVW